MAESATASTGMPSLGMPLLSGLAPRLTDSNSRAESSCRKCNKEFNILFTRSRKCNHCAYFYCNSCTDYQALMPREGGYDPVPVCAFCIENLTITASGKSHLRSLPIARLKRYSKDYNIRLGESVLEKDDVIDTLIRARERNGCLSSANEDYYRRYSVPNRQGGKPIGIFSRPGRSTQPGPSERPPVASPTPPQSTFARPDLEPQGQRGSPGPARPTPPRPADTYASSANSTPNRNTSASSPRPTPASNYPRYSHPQYQPSPPRGAPYQRPPSTRPSGANMRSTTPNLARQSNSNLGAPSQRPRATSASPNVPPRPATTTPVSPNIPTLDVLLNLSESDVAALSISTLKGVLFQNHVRASAGLVLEKSELVDQVKRLVADERRERAREAALREAEEQEAIARQHAMMEEHKRKEEERQRQQETREATSSATIATTTNEESTSVVALNSVSSRSPLAGAETVKPPEQSSDAPPKISPAASLLERNGLCVICQDEDANIAIMDCGHLCLCRGCSDLIMNSSRECPLCRTRIVTEARLLRIFKA